MIIIIIVLLINDMIISYVCLVYVLLLNKPYSMFVRAWRLGCRWAAACVQHLQGLLPLFPGTVFLETNYVIGFMQLLSAVLNHIIEDLVPEHKGNNPYEAWMHPPRDRVTHASAKVCRAVWSQDTEITRYIGTSLYFDDVLLFSNTA